MTPPSLALALAPAPGPAAPRRRVATREQVLMFRLDPRRAVGEDDICCLVCGQILRQLTNTHLRAHGITADEYKRGFGYNRRRPLMCGTLWRLYAVRAVRVGLASRIRSRPILTKPELRRRGGTRAISLEERLTRRDAQSRGRGALVVDLDPIVGD